jgi:hypothetical protein
MRAELAVDRESGDEVGRAGFNSGIDVREFVHFQARLYVVEWYFGE